MNAFKMVLVSVLLFGAVPAVAVIETYEFSEPVLEERYQALSAELRCPKCQNQNIADSNAPIAQDLRKLLHQQLEEGASDDEILDHMVDRYGEFVRYRPRFAGTTLVLWLAPILLLAAGGAIVLLSLRGRGETQAQQASPKQADSSVPGAALSAEEQARIDSLLQDEGRNS